jgi:outer membrane biosynthesis protein TonB
MKQVVRSIEIPRAVAMILAVSVHFCLLLALLFAVPQRRLVTETALPILFVTDTGRGLPPERSRKPDFDTKLEDMQPDIPVNDTEITTAENTIPLNAPLATQSETFDPNAGATGYGFVGNGYSSSGVVRLPVRPVEPHHQKQFAAALKSSHPISDCATNGGTAGISVYVLPSGQVSEIAYSRSSGCPELDAFVASIVKGTTGLYKPAAENGKSVGAWYAEGDIIVPPAATAR